MRGGSRRNSHGASTRLSRSCTNTPCAGITDEAEIAFDADGAGDQQRRRQADVAAGTALPGIQDDVGRFVGEPHPQLRPLLPETSGMPQCSHLPQESPEGRPHVLHRQVLLDGKVATAGASTRRGEQRQHHLALGGVGARRAVAALELRFEDTPARTQLPFLPVVTGRRRSVGAGVGHPAYREGLGVTGST